MLAATGILHILTRSHQIFITDHAKKLHRQVYPIFSYTGHLQTRENQRRWQTTAVNVRFMMMDLATVWHCYLHTKVRKRLSVTKQRCMGRCSNWQVMQLSRRLPLTITCSSTCLNNTENTLQLTKGKCHTFIQTTCFFFFYSVKMSGWLHKMESAIRLSSGVSASSLQMICRHCCSSLTR